ncbi:MAG: nucleotidyltransferase family protein [Parafilimonas sp.]|nr:nucleotidyltransferase family protein [Parafilimonas sp.]
MQQSSIIILAGGLGTRLRSVVSDLPKCMAPVNGKPFLDYVINYFQQQCINNIIFSLGYKHEVIEEHISSHFSHLTFHFSIEEEPLGTGGAIKKACSLVNSKNVFVTNGDTLFKANTSALQNFHQQKKADCTLALKPMKNFDRYGVIELNEDDSIKSFNEKKYYEQGLINGGLYMLNVESFLKESFPEKFSFETAYLEKYYNQHKMFGLIQDEYFIDIGIPEDYAKAAKEL